jgi:hypothetical protein
MKLFSEKKPDVGGIYQISVALILAYFLIRLLCLAISINHYIPPDEITHLGRIQAYSKVLLFPVNSEQTHAFGLVTHEPYLYPFIMGKLLSVKFFPVSDLVYLRLINCIISFFMVLYAYKWFRIISPDRLCQLLFLILITNTPMFSFMCAALSYDTFTNFFAVTSLYYLYRFFARPHPACFFLFIISVGAGTLSKISFLPLVLIYAGIFVFHFRKNLKDMVPLIRTLFPTLDIKVKVLAGIAFLVLILNVKLYAGNLLQFGKIVPESDQVLSEEQCMKYRIYAHKKIVEQYKKGELTFEQAVQKAEKHIQHSGDLNGTIFLLRVRKADNENPRPLINRIHFIAPWFKIMFKTVFGIQGHTTLIKDSYTLFAFKLIFLFSLIIILLRWKTLAKNKFMVYALFLQLLYLIILMQYVNYQNYKEYAVMALSFQGRYIFPVLAPIYGLIAHYILNNFKNYYRITVFTIVSILMIWGDFPYFLYNAHRQWFF